MMNQDTDELDIHTLFGALTRPAMTAGVPFEYHGINLMISVCTFILFSNLLYGLLFIPIHVFGWLVCRYDVHFFQVVLKRWTMPLMPNQSLHGVRYYEPY